MKIWETLMCVEVLTCLMSKYLSFFPAWRVFRHTGMHVILVIKLAVTVSKMPGRALLAISKLCIAFLVLTSLGYKLHNTLQDHNTTYTTESADTMSISLA